MSKVVWVQATTGVKSLPTYLIKVDETSSFEDLFFAYSVEANIEPCEVDFESLQVNSLTNPVVTTSRICSCHSTAGDQFAG